MGKPGRLGASLIVSAAFWLAPVTAARAGSEPSAIVSLGDSFISGEGGRWLGNGSEPLGTRSGTDRAAFGCDGLALRVRPGAGLRAFGGERLPPLRRGADPQRAGGGRGEGQPRLLGGEGRERLPASAGGQRTLRRAAAGGPAGRASPGATTCGWSCSPSAPTTSASASWWPGVRWTGRAAPRTTRSLCRGDAQAEVEAALPTDGTPAAEGTARHSGRRWPLPATGRRTTGW